MSESEIGRAWFECEGGDVAFVDEAHKLGSKSTHRVTKRPDDGGAGPATVKEAVRESPDNGNRDGLVGRNRIHNVGYVNPRLQLCLWAGVEVEAERDFQ